MMFLIFKVLLYLMIIKLMNGWKENYCKRKKKLLMMLEKKLRNNCNLVYKGNFVFFENWIKLGILYIKDLFDDEGNFRWLEYYVNIINKFNWLCEYKIFF